MDGEIAFVVAMFAFILALASFVQVIDPVETHRPYNLFDEPSWIRSLYLPLGTWRKHEVSLLGVGGWHNAFVSHPRPIYNEAESEYWVYFAGGTQYRSIGLATGENLTSPLTEITDGISGTSRVLDKNTGKTFEYSGVSFPTVIYDPMESNSSKRWKMLYVGRNNVNIYEKIGYAFSGDGKTWTREPTNPVFEIAGRRVDAPALFRLGNKFYMLYHQSMVDPVHLGLAFSDDCITWTEYAGNPILQLGDSGDWDDNSVHYVTMYFDQGTFYLSYTGNDGGFNKIGLAISTNCLNWTKLPYNPVLTDSVSVATGCMIRMETIFYMLYEHDSPKSIRCASIP